MPRPPESFMIKRAHLLAASCLLSFLLGCGARSSLPEGDGQGSSGSGGAGGSAAISSSSSSSGASTGTGGSMCIPAPEICNGVDDNCNGVIDADCEKGSCSPTLRVVSLTKSMDSCFVDAVQVDSEGVLDFPCEGGPVSAMFGPILFDGAITAGALSMSATTTFEWSDGCTWGSNQTITGTLASGSLAYTYEELPIAGINCLPPCTASGSLDVEW
jgi:hypothetical protein